ncbi:class I SAM-dependent methyltransferase [Acholeplasma hippikon]|uniref:Protoporphyrinogen oxidase n=1 Tax=Acholeplasma hippikon TaxID=264636 RepID=A0A449BKE4_9MOLU|nr:class I SAM-dependent methyltransferase [Acholeplasma hippikon]VEU82914.1 protoporphyrinogen oxidase [Acholeplasma hippikon]
MSHYFINDPNLKSQERVYHINFANQPFEFTTDKGVFSQDGLDFGSELLLKEVQIKPETKTLLDVGCGVGVLGIILKKLNPGLEVTMSDVNLRALSLAKKNAQKNQIDAKIIESNLYEHIDDKFDLIISNPPIRAGKKIIYTLYSDAIKHLNAGGELWIVVRKQQGAKSTIEFLKTRYDQVDVVARDKGFYIIKSKKN